MRRRSAPIAQTADAKWKGCNFTPLAKSTRKPPTALIPPGGSNECAKQTGESADGSLLLPPSSPEPAAGSFCAAAPIDGTAHCVPSGQEREPRVQLTAAADYDATASCHWSQRRRCDPSRVGGDDPKTEALCLLPAVSHVRRVRALPEQPRRPRESHRRQALRRATGEVHDADA